MASQRVFVAVCATSGALGMWYFVTPDQTRVTQDSKHDSAETQLVSPAEFAVALRAGQRVQPAVAGRELDYSGLHLRFLTRFPSWWETQMDTARINGRQFAFVSGGDVAQALLKDAQPEGRTAAAAAAESSCGQLQ